MNSTHRLFKAGFCLILASGLSSQAGTVPASAPAAYPAWWFERDVIVRKPGATTNVWPGDYPTADDYAAANLGQLKQIAIQAATEFDRFFPSPGAGEPIHALVATWRVAASAGTNRDDYAALNQGQLKAIAVLYYNRLADFAYNAPPLTSGQFVPWTINTSDDNSYALVNLGQLKQVFSFDLMSTLDIDGDGLLDSWEISYFGPLLTTQSGLENADGDLLNNRSEYLLGTNPLPSSPVAVVVPSALELVIFSP